MMMFSFRSVLRALVSVMLIYSFGITPVLSAPDTKSPAELCRDIVALRVREIEGSIPASWPGNYKLRLDELLSTHSPSHELLPQLRDLAVRMKLEYDAFCRAVSGFSAMTRFEEAAFELSACRSDELGGVSWELDIRRFCVSETEASRVWFLRELRQRIQLDALEESLRPLIFAYRRINSKMSLLLSDYSRLIQNMLTLNNRLGNFVVKKSN